MVRWVAAGSNTVIADTSVAALIDDADSATAAAARAASGTFTGERTWTAQQTFDSGLRLTRGTVDWLMRGEGANVEFRLDGASDWLARLEDDGDFQVRGQVISRGFVGSAKAGARIPFNNFSTIDGSTLSAVNPGDKVGMQNSVTFKGGFSNEAALGMANPGFLWGANDFILTGTAAGDVAGITDIQARLTEVHLRTPGATVNNVSGMVAESNISAEAVGATVTGWLASQIVRGPINLPGASVAKAASLLLGTPAPGTATEQWAIYSEGIGNTRLGGDILMNNDPANAKTLNAYSGEVRGKTLTVGATSLTSAARITSQSTADGEIVAWLRGRGGQTEDILRIGQDTTVHSKFDKRGRLGMRQVSVPADADVATNEWVFYVDNTAGAPKLMAKCKDSAGTVFTKTVVA